MTDNNQQPPEDFSHQEHQEMVEEAAPAGLGANLKNAWRTKPLFKLIVIMVVVGAVVAVISNFLGGGKDSSNVAKVVAPPSTMGGQAPGGKETPYRMKELNEANKNGEQRAFQKGDSFIPTPHGEESNVDEAKDPLKELQTQIDRMNRALEDQKRQAQLQQAAPKPQVQQQQPEKFDNSLAQAMQSEMQKLIGTDWKPKGMHVVTGDKDQAKEAAAAAAASASASNPLNGNQVPVEYKTVVPAGTVNYGQLLTEANSDVPGPILAQIVSGPLAGARAVGSFRVINDYLVMHFEIANLKNKDYQIDALALDPDTTLGGMATEVDERYFTRVVLPAAAAFMEGLGQELGQPNTTVTSTGTTTIVSQGSQGFREGMYEGFGAAATTAGQFFRDQANKTQPLVRVAAGTPIGLFFVHTVTDESAEQIQAAQQAAVANGATTSTGGPAVVTNFGGGQPISQQGAQQAGPYGNGPLGTVSTGPYGSGTGGGYGGYGGGYGGGGYSGVPGALPGYR